MGSLGLAVPPLVLGNSHLYCTLSSNKLKYIVDSLRFYIPWALQRLYMNEKETTVFFSSAYIYTPFSHWVSISKYQFKDKIIQFHYGSWRTLNLGVGWGGALSDYWGWMSYSDPDLLLWTLTLQTLQTLTHHNQQKSQKCCTWMQSQKWQYDLCSIPRQTIQYHSNPGLCPN